MVRSTNQDRYTVWRFGVDAEDRDEVYTLCAVADGMGGSAAGDRASALTLSVLSERLLNLLASRCGELRPPQPDISRVLVDCVTAANACVLDTADSHSDLRGMGSTLTAGVLSRGVLYLAQVGDSRCYRLRQESLEQLTTDHSIVGELVRQGKLSAEAARKHPRRNIITRAIGVQEELTVDVSCHVVEEGDVYMLCSDGLWELIPDTKIQEMLADLHSFDSTDLQRMCQNLVDAALSQGGDDNITVLLGVAAASDLHPDAGQVALTSARTRVETGATADTDLKQTLRFRLQEWQQ